MSRMYTILKENCTLSNECGIGEDSDCMDISMSGRCIARNRLDSEDPCEGCETRRECGDSGNPDCQFWNKYVSDMRRIGIIVHGREKE